MSNSREDASVTSASAENTVKSQSGQTEKDMMKSVSNVPITPEGPDSSLRGECMSCKLVAFTTPLMISAYFIYQHSSVAKVAAMPLAKTWTGKRRWRLHAQRFNGMVTMPFMICYLTYSWMFEFGLHHPKAREQKPPKSLEHAVTDFTEVHQTDSFTRWTLQFADWVSSSVSEKRESIADMLERSKRMFGTDGKPTPRTDVEPLGKKGDP